MHVKWDSPPFAVLDRINAANISRRFFNFFLILSPITPSLLIDLFHSDTPDRYFCTFVASPICATICSRIFLPNLFILGTIRSRRLQTVAVLCWRLSAS